MSRREFLFRGGVAIGGVAAGTGSLGLIVDGAFGVKGYNGPIGALVNESIHDELATPSQLDAFAETSDYLAVRMVEGVVEILSGTLGLVWSYYAWVSAVEQNSEQS